MESISSLDLAVARRIARPRCLPVSAASQAFGIGT